MAKRSKIVGLPAAVRSWLDAALTQGNFSGYEQLEAELTQRGYGISKSAIHRYGQNMERRLAAVRASTEAARQIAEAAPDEADQRSAAVISLVQTDIFNVLLLLQEADSADPGERLKLMGRAAKNIAELSRASVNQKKHEASVNARVRAAADSVEAIAKKGGLSAEALDTIRRDILGIAA